MIELKMQQVGTRCFSVYASKMLIDGYVVKIDYSDIKAKVDRKRICVWASMIYVILVAAGFVCRSQAWIVAIILIKPFAEALISTSLWTMIPLAARNTAERSWGIAFFTLLSNLAMLVSAPIVGKMASQLSWLAAGGALAVVAALGAVTAGLYRNDAKC